MAASDNTPSARDLELLSAYLDGELSPRERQALEQRLGNDAALRAALESLRETVFLVRGLPRLTAPRSFALDPAHYRQKLPWWQRLWSSGTVLQFAGAAGTFASLVVIMVAFLVSSEGKTLDKSGYGDLAQAAQNQAVIGYALTAEFAGTTPTYLALAARSPTPTITLLSEEAEAAIREQPAESPTLENVPAMESAIVPAAPLEAADAILGSEAGGAGLPPGQPAPAAIPQGAIPMPSASPAVVFQASAAKETPSAASEGTVFESQVPATMTLPPAVYATQAPTQAQQTPLTGEAAAEFAAGQAVAATSAPTLTASPTPAAVAQAAGAGNDDEDTARRQEQPSSAEESGPAWVWIGLGAAGLVLSVSLYIAGRRRVRRR